ncbi:enolase-phosphatase E1-like [Branchiostoma lanceolatum]|uniref:enolase-phosphatase E1-like n=1 Tax=Branchiostoma lanceolatum TaxID=7740 RepID=UPI0034560D35
MKLGIFLVLAALLGCTSANLQPNPKSNKKTALVDKFLAKKAGIETPAQKQTFPQDWAKYVEEKLTKNLKADEDKTARKQHKNARSNPLLSKLLRPRGSDVTAVKPAELERVSSQHFRQPEEKVESYISRYGRNSHVDNVMKVQEMMRHVAEISPDDGSDVAEMVPDFLRGHNAVQPGIPHRDHDGHAPMVDPEEEKGHRHPNAGVLSGKHSEALHKGLKQSLPHTEEEEEEGGHGIHQHQKHPESIHARPRPVGEENKAKDQAKGSSSPAEEDAENAGPPPEAAPPTQEEGMDDADAGKSNDIVENSKIQLMKRMVAFAKVVKKMKEGSEEEKEEALEEAKEMFSPEVLSAIKSRIDEASNDLEKDTDKPAEHLSLSPLARERLRQSGRMHMATNENKGSSDEKHTEGSDENEGDDGQSKEAGETPSMEEPVKHYPSPSNLRDRLRESGRLVSREKKSSSNEKQTGGSEDQEQTKETGEGPTVEESPKIILHSGEKEEATKIATNSDGPARALSAIMKAMATAKERQETSAGAEVENQASKVSEELNPTLTPENEKKKLQALEAIKHAMEVAKGHEETLASVEVNDQVASENIEKEHPEINNKDSAQEATIQNEPTSDKEEDAARALEEAIKKAVAKAKGSQQETPASAEAKKQEPESQQPALTPENEKKKLQAIEAIMHAMEVAKGREEHPASLEEKEDQVHETLAVVKQNKEEEHQDISNTDSDPKSAIVADKETSQKASQDDKLDSNSNVFNILRQVDELRKLKHEPADDSSMGDEQVSQEHESIAEDMNSVDNIVDNKQMSETLDVPPKHQSKEEKAKGVLEMMAQLQAAAVNQNKQLHSREKSTKTAEKSEDEKSRSRSQAELADEALGKILQDVGERAQAQKKDNPTTEITQEDDTEAATTHQKEQLNSKEVITNMDEKAETGGTKGVTESGSKSRAELAMEAIEKLRHEVRERAHAQEKDKPTPETPQASEEDKSGQDQESDGDSEKADASHTETAQEDDMDSAENEAVDAKQNEELHSKEADVEKEEKTEDTDLDSERGAGRAMKAIGKILREVGERAHAKEKDNPTMVTAQASQDTAETDHKSDVDAEVSSQAEEDAENADSTPETTLPTEEEGIDNAETEADSIVEKIQLMQKMARLAEVVKKMKEGSEEEKEEALEEAKEMLPPEILSVVKAKIAEESGKPEKSNEDLREETVGESYEADVEDDSDKNQGTQEAEKDLDGERNGGEAGENMEEDELEEKVKFMNAKAAEDLHLAVAEPEDHVDGKDNDEQTVQESGEDSNKSDEAPPVDKLLSQQPDDRMTTKSEEAEAMLNPLEGLAENDHTKGPEDTEIEEGNEIEHIREALSQKAAAAQEARRKAVIAAAIAQSHLKAHDIKVAKPKEDPDAEDDDVHHKEDATSVKKTAYFLSKGGKLMSSEEVLKEDKKPKVLMVKNNLLTDGGAKTSEETLEEGTSEGKKSQDDKIRISEELLKEEKEGKSREDKMGLEPASPFLKGAFMKGKTAQQTKPDKEQSRSAKKTSKMPPFYLSKEREVKSSKESLEKDGRSAGNEEKNLARPLPKSVARKNKIGDRLDKTSPYLLANDGEAKISKEVLPEDKKEGRSGVRKLAGSSPNAANPKKEKIKLNKPDTGMMTKGKKKSAKPKTLFGKVVKAGKHRNLAKLREMAKAMAKRRLPKGRRA